VRWSTPILREKKIPHGPYPRKLFIGGHTAWLPDFKEKYQTITQLKIGTFMVMAEPAYVNGVVNAETNVDILAEGKTFGRCILY
jgi:hypothetical protein